MMKIDEDFGADDLKDETWYWPNINTTSKALGYFCTRHSILRKKVIPKLKPGRGGKSANVCYEGHFKNIGWQNVFREHEGDHNFIPAYGEAVLLIKQLVVNFRILKRTLQKTFRSHCINK